MTGTQAKYREIVLTYAGDGLRHWSGDKDVWLYGYWVFDWADAYVPVNSIDAGTHALHVPRDIPLGATSGARFRAINLLEELNKPGEWYLDREKGLLYFWPIAPIQPNSAVVSMATNRVEMNNVSNVTLGGVTLEACRGTAVTLTGCSRCRIAARNVGGIDLLAVNP